MSMPLQRLRKNQKGFTLIELLVVIGILGVLAAVAIPAYSAFFGSGKTEANKSELDNIQAAMDSMMAAKGIQTVDQYPPTTGGTATNDFSALPTGTNTEPLSPKYLRKNPTRCSYTWTTSGLLTQASCPS